MISLSDFHTEFRLSPTLHANEMVAARRAQGHDVYHLGFGQAPFPVPPRLQKALQQNTGHKDYLPTAGLPELRTAIADYYKDKYGTDAGAHDVFLAPGSKLILYAVQMAVEGDLIMPVPSWVSYAPQSKMLHNKVVKVHTRLDDDGLHLDPETLRETVKKARDEGLNPTKLILNYPSNPTGLTITPAELEAIAGVCRDEDLLIIADAIYAEVMFDGKEHCCISQYAPERTIMTTAVSKHLSLGGWRMGVGFIPKEIDGLFGHLLNIASETWSSVATPIQYALVEAYQGHDDIEDFIRDSTAIHALMNRYIAEKLRELGVGCPMPQGAFYCYPNFSAFKDKLAARGIHTSRDLAETLLAQHGIATLPGVAFGETDDVLTLRLSGCDYNGEKAMAAYRGGEVLDERFIANHAPNIQGAMQAFAKFMQSL